MTTRLRHRVGGIGATNRQKFFNVFSDGTTPKLHSRSLDTAQLARGGPSNEGSESDAGAPKHSMPRKGGVLGVPEGTAAFHDSTESLPLINSDKRKLKKSVSIRSPMKTPLDRTRTPSRQTSGSQTPVGEFNASVSIDSAESQTELESKILKRKIQEFFVQNKQPIREFFMNISQHEGTISVDKMRKAIEGLNLGGTNRAVEKILKEADVDGNGIVDYEEFIGQFRNVDTYEGSWDVDHYLGKSFRRDGQEMKQTKRRALNETEQKNARKVVKKISNYLYNRYGGVRAAFRAFDENKDGVITLTEIENGLKKTTNLNLTHKEMIGFLQLLDVNLNGLVEFSEFSSKMDKFSGAKDDEFLMPPWMKAARPTETHEPQEQLTRAKSAPSSEFYKSKSLGSTISDAPYESLAHSYTFPQHAWDCADGTELARQRKSYIVNHSNSLDLRRDTPAWATDSERHSLTVSGASLANSVELAWARNTDHPSLKASGLSSGEHATQYVAARQELIDNAHKASQERSRLERWKQGEYRTVEAYRKYDEKQANYHKGRINTCGKLRAHHHEIAAHSHRNYFNKGKDGMPYTNIGDYLAYQNQPDSVTSDSLTCRDRSLLFAESRCCKGTCHCRPVIC
ncbi:hypothetical protein CYMTET_16120 [Cymbomonas tetramitiformis]|uniref:EF-hand domain-containing protein n=1 Tax=Cymbomonas tetramitiformis TaxID=36881 RepID=A0AAE0L891_9CHLO|nr:hypothetical protein CYMTET_16120 [Cymbomonas tetramitiformis]